MTRLRRSISALPRNQACSDASTFMRRASRDANRRRRRGQPWLAGSCTAAKADASARRTPDPMIISIVTPCLNSGEFIDRTICSVVHQKCFAVEYIIADGGSTDGTLDSIRRHGSAISRVVSEPDEGHYDAINKGFAISTGQVMGWLNSSDIYFPWT